MKKHLLILTLLITFNGLTQNDTVISNIEATWGLREHDVQGWPHNTRNETLKNDSVFHMGGYWSSYYCGSVNTSSRSAYIKTDSGKVYCKFLDYNNCIYDTTTIFLLYDFNLNVGDTIPVYEGVCSPDNFITTIQLIDEITISGRTRKRLTLSDGDVWISGIGSLNGLLHPIYQIEGLGISNLGLCFYNGKYIDSLGQPYELDIENPLVCTSNTEEQENNPFQIIPSTETLIIKFELPNQEYSIFDLQGKIVLSGVITSSNQHINWGTLNNGAYLVKVKNHAQKVIKQ